MSELYSVNCKQVSKENTEEYVCCDICGHKDINPNDLDIHYNLSLMFGGYCHNTCITEEMEKEYEETLKN